MREVIRAFARFGASGGRGASKTHNHKCAQTWTARAHMPKTIHRTNANLRARTHTRTHRSISSARRCSKSRPAPSPPDARRRRPPDGRRLLRRLAPSGWALPSALYKIYISIYCLPIHIPVNRLPMKRCIACLCINPFVMPSLLPRCLGFCAWRRPGEPEPARDYYPDG